MNIFKFAKILIKFNGQTSMGIELIVSVVYKNNQEITFMTSNSYYECAHSYVHY